MTENPEPSFPGADADFEGLEARLRETLERLGGEGLTLEQRLTAHRHGLRLHEALARKLKQAEARIEAPAEAAEDEDEDDVEGMSYEQARGALEKAVARLEQDDLPLAEVVIEARRAARLADRCEAILKSAEGRIEKVPDARPEPPEKPRTPIPFKPRSPADPDDEDPGEIPF